MGCRERGDGWRFETIWSTCGHGIKGRTLARVSRLVLGAMHSDPAEASSGDGCASNKGADQIQGGLRATNTEARTLMASYDLRLKDLFRIQSRTSHNYRGIFWLRNLNLQQLIFWGVLFFWLHQQDEVLRAC